MQRLMWFGAILLVCLLSSPLIMAYDDAQDATLAEMQALLDELNEAIYRAEVGRSAHPAFLEHLRDLEMGLQDLLARLLAERDEPAEWGDYMRPEDAKPVLELQRVLGGIKSLEDGVWETDRGTPTVAIAPDQEYSSVAIEATVTFLKGYRELSFGLYHPDGYLMAVGGTGVHRARGFVGVGDARTPSARWSNRLGKEAELESNRPYRIRVEVRVRKDSTKIDLLIDGERVLSQVGETAFASGYPAIRTWNTEARIENLTIEELAW
ncbi:MAG: hypothetical protein ACOX20_07450 [Limnochordia bacterium]|jgi:hypothetical protein